MRETVTWTDINLMIWKVQYISPWFRSKFHCSSKLLCMIVGSCCLDT